MGLAMKPTCERCSAALPMHSNDAWICSHECTFCGQCADEVSRRCPNCGGDLVTRPRRLPAGGATEILNT